MGWQRLYALPYDSTIKQHGQKCEAMKCKTKKIITAGQAEIGGVRFLKRIYKYNELYKKHICLPRKLNEKHNIYEK